MRNMILNFKLLKSFITLFCVLLIVACAKDDEARNPPLNLESVSISLDNDANLNSATAIELLIVYKMELLKALMKINAVDYFASADQIKRDYPDMVEVYRWELTPGQAISDYKITVTGDDPLGVVIFADYLTPGNHRERVGSTSSIHLRLKNKDFCILEQGCRFEKTGPTKSAEDLLLETIRAGMVSKPINSESLQKESEKKNL
jgi:type VI secretion system protein